MKLVVHPSRLRGEICVPGSKSHTIRGIAVGLLAEGEVTLRHPLRSADTLSVLRAAGELGLAVPDSGQEWRFQGLGGAFRPVSRPLDLGNSGTGLCILTALAATQGFPCHFDGDASLRSRSLQSELEALAALGARQSSTAGKCPLMVCGPLAGGETTVDGSNSQYLTALLFAAPLAAADTDIRLRFLREKPYVAMTLDWLGRCGITVDAGDDFLHFHIPGRQRYRGLTADIPADFSTAAFPLAAGLLAGEGVVLRNLNFTDVQGDKVIFEFAAAMGAVLPHDRAGVLVTPVKGRLRGGQFDLNACPDTLPVMAVLGALAEGETVLANVAQARQKETDRIACMARELAKMGARIKEREDGLAIVGGTLRGAEMHGCGDHRIVMALAVAALAAEGPSVIDGAEVAAVTYPEFVADFQRLGADMEMVP
ncbi:MAG: 3-phosphoshikimate 1-carboxyvinyltransferase [Lentisphaeria bacterium]|jgi:3-phosphoshikimate 1-carboxyvinyltransferase|nr:3-phosphoshikimate 1-carboxyvinyltransferase [Lentisphaeria bacterium]